MSRARATGGLGGVLLVLLIHLAGCAGPTTSKTPLAGTSWVLQSFQSMDDAQGILRPSKGRVYEMHFGTDGTVRFTLDCNRASGTWEGRAVADQEGTLIFGPLAGTRALCAPPAMDEKIARDMGYIRSYRIVDGHLYLALMADGGIYEWSPLR